jgi:hypothetical protein
VTHAHPVRDSAADGGAKDAKGADQQKTVVLPPVVHQAPILVAAVGGEHQPKTGFARQRERMTETKTSKTGKTGAWSTGKDVKLAENPGASGVIAVSGVSAAEGEEKGVDIPASGKEFFESWAGKEEKEEEKDSTESKGESTGEGGSTGDSGGDSGGSEGSEGSTEGSTEGGGDGAGGFETEIDGFTLSGETSSEVKTGEGASIGGFGSDPEVRKATEVLAFANERREGGPKPKSHEVGTGAKGSASASMETRKGATRQSASAEAKGLAGARAAAQTLAVADQRELTAAVTALAQAGAFGDAGAKYDVKRGRAALEAHTKASGGVGVQARGRAVAHVDLNPLLPTLVLFCEGAAQAGIWGDVEAGLRASYGKVIAEAKIKASGFAGVAVDAKAAVFGNAIEGIGASVQASGKAGAEGKVVATQTIAIEGLGELEFEQGILAFAGAQARAKAKASISLTGVTLTAKASAFAGVKTSAWASVAGKLRGREVVKVGGTIGVSVGAGAEIGGSFSFQHGKLVIAGDLAAALKVGGNIGGTFELDVAALATSILELVADQFNKSELKINKASPDYQREDVADEKSAEALEKAAYKAVIDLFDDYAVEVMDKIHHDKLTGPQSLDPARIQKIIQKAAVEGQLRSTYKETDRGIIAAASDAFGVISDGGGDKSKAVQGLLLYPIDVQALVVRSMQSAPPKQAKEQATKYAEAAAARKARGALEKDLKEYGTKKTRETASSMHQYGVQKIADKHWKELEKAFPNGQAASEAADAVVTTLGSFLGDPPVEVAFSPIGLITKFPSFDTRYEASRETRQQTAQNAEEKKVLAVHEVLKSGLAGYKTQLIASTSKEPKDDQVNKLISKACSDIKSELNGPHKDGIRQGVQDLVRQELASLTTSVTFGGGITTTAIAWDAKALQDARDGKAADAAAAKRQAALNNLHAAVKATVRKKAKKGKGTGVEAIDTKWNVIAKLRTELPKAVTIVTGIDGKPKADKALDTELTDLINEALGGLFTLTVVDGAVPIAGISSMADNAVFAEQHRTEHASLKGGEEQDNARRRIVADALRKPFVSYSTQVRKAVSDKARGGTVKITGVEKARLQAIIDKGLKSSLADVANAVGDDALVDTAATHFGITGNDRSGPGPVLLKKFRSQGLKIAEFEAVPVAEAAQGKSAVLAERKAVSTLEKEIRDMADRVNGKIGPGQLNRAIAASGVAAIDSINVDSVIVQAVSLVWPGTIKQLDVDQGTVKAFELGRTTQLAAKGSNP